MPSLDRPSLAPYAVTSAYGALRTHDEPDDPLRDPFEVDRHRIMQSTAFRRLVGKTQVFAPSYHDHFRTRLTHTLEVACIARTLARHLRVNEHLTEAIALAHDLGHAPFGHAGESALRQRMADHGGFNHNTHALRVVDYLEHPFPGFRGLNLTQATRAGLLTHATPYDRPAASDHEPPPTCIEAQIVSLADRIAYNLHDLEDAIGAELLTVDDLREVELWREAYEGVSANDSPRSIHALRRSVLDAILDRLLIDSRDTALNMLGRVASVEQVRKAGKPFVQLSQVMARRLTELESFLARRVYRHESVARPDARGQSMIRALFDGYLADPGRLPSRFATRIARQGPHRVICDYIAGMTDRYCRDACEKLTNSHPAIRDGTIP